MSTYTSFEQLDCYRKCRLVRIWIYHFLERFNIRDRDIIQNIKRAGRSTTMNIAEGFGRHHYKENRQFCRISWWSCHQISFSLTRIGNSCKMVIEFKYI